MILHICILYRYILLLYITYIIFNKYNIHKDKSVYVISFIVIAIMKNLHANAIE